MGGVKRIEHNGKLLAIVIKENSFQHMQEQQQEINFTTPDEFPFQVGLHKWQTGKKVKEHFHLPFEKLENFPVQEFFYVKNGKVRIDLYDDEQNDAKVSEIIVESGDTIILNTGHGMESLEPSELIELKQGPYRGKEAEKRYFS